MTATSEVLYTFPADPNGDSKAVEWPGTPIGPSNCITRTKSRTQFHDKAIDAKPGRREELLDSVVQYIVTHAREKPIYSHDVVIHGVRVRAVTNSDHLIDFWRDNWYSVDEWQAVTGRTAPEKPQIRVYAFGGVEDQAEGAYYSRSANTVIFFNTSYYGQLKSWVLGAVGRVLADDYGIHSIHGAAVEKDGKGVLYIAPTGTGKSTSSYGLMHFPNTRFHSDDWVYVRYVYHTRDGRLVGPRLIEAPDGTMVRGYRCFRWLENHPQVDAPLIGLTPDNEEVALRTSDLDLSRGLEAYGYISEKVFYLRCNLVENFPEAAAEILNSKMENVPDVTPAFMEKHRELVESVARTVMESDNPRLRQALAGKSPEEVKIAMARLFAFDNARAMLDITKVFERERCYVDPLEGLHLTTVFLLKRNFDTDDVLERLSLERFMERLLIGETPMGTREIAYNAYRATDDESERKWIAWLEAEAKAQGRPLYHLFEERRDVPDSLLEEFELFRAMYRACACYDLNTILQKDPAIKDRQEAVARTMQLIAAAIDQRPQGRYTIANYAALLR
ncbi:MAG TPA: hypothetical protein VFB73_03140 [Chloroflexota bacterium]|nr:hypothetical protein [Chloroflexota bacterium]